MKEKKQKLIEDYHFINTLGINEIGFKEEYLNGKLIKVRLIKLLLFDKSNNNYRFQYDNEKSNEFLNISGNLYPIHEWKSNPDQLHKTIIKSNKSW